MTKIVVDRRFVKLYSCNKHKLFAGKFFDKDKKLDIIKVKTEISEL